MKRLTIYFLIIFSLESCYKEDIHNQPSGKIKNISTYYEAGETRFDMNHYYNSSNQLAKEISVNQSGEEVGEILYSYNSLAQLIEKENNIPGRYKRENYTYDSDGKLINQTGYGSPSFDCFYDEFDRLISKKTYTKIFQGKHYRQIISFQYDSIHINRITDEKFENIQEINFLYEHLKYLYDDEGRLEQKKVVDGAEFLYRDTKEFFVYDNDGRLFKKVVYDLNMGLHPGLESTATYYYFD